VGDDDQNLLELVARADEVRRETKRIFDDLRRNHDRFLQSIGQSRQVLAEFWELGRGTHDA
jgi:hypothetical protein